MGKISAELLKEKISIEAVLQIQMSKLKKLIPHAQQISVKFLCGEHCLKVGYCWGRFSELFPVNAEFEVDGLIEAMGTNIRVVTNPDDVVRMIGNCSPAVSVILKTSKKSCIYRWQPKGSCTA